MKSLRLRLLLSAMLSVSVALAIAGVVLVVIFGQHVQQRYVKELEDHLLQLAAVIQFDAAGQLTLKHDLSDPAFSRPLSGLYWQVSEAGRVLRRSRSLWDSRLSLGRTTAAPGERRVQFIAGPTHQPLVVVERGVLLGERPLRLIVAGDRTVVYQARNDFAEAVALSLTVLAALLAGASWLQVGAGLAPLRDLRLQLNRLRQGRTERLEGTYPVELSGLVADLNRLLAAQAQEAERARTNAGKLGHGLKTPLAILGAEARALRDKGDATSAGAIEHEIATMNAHVARILAAVRAVGPRKAVGVVTPLEPLLRRLVDVMKRLPRGDELTWHVSASQTGIQVPIDHRDLEDLFGNLLDNARKWAASEVRVNVSQDGATVHVSVEDDGPGIPADRTNDVLEKGIRLDRAIPGTGIGLAIARDLAELHGGSLQLGTGARGGLKTTVRLPSDKVRHPIDNVAKPDAT